MNEPCVTNSLMGHNRLFTTALMASLLVHIAALWMGQSLLSVAGQKNFTENFTKTIDVALVAARAVRERASARQIDTTREVAMKPAPHHDEKKSEANNEEVTPLTEFVAPSDGTSQKEETVTKESDALTQSSQSVDPDARDRYLASVLERIETYKFYPLPAQRQGVQGHVDVRFTLDAQGGISDLDINGSNAMFVEAAKEAIKGAMPLPHAPFADGFPVTVHYQMIFKLQ